MVQTTFPKLVWNDFVWNNKGGIDTIMTISEGEMNYVTSSTESPGCDF